MFEIKFLNIENGVIKKNLYIVLLGQLKSRKAKTHHIPYVKEFCVNGL